MNKDYTIVIHTDTPFNFDALDGTLAGDWDATMTNATTGDSWTKEGTARESSTTAPMQMEVVDDHTDPA